MSVYNPTHDLPLDTHSDIHDVESDTTHVLLGTSTLLGGPLETSDTRVLDFVEVLHTLGDIDQQVGASGLRTETPDLPGVGDIPSVLVGKETSSDLEVVSRSNGTRLDGLGELLVKGTGGEEETVVLVLGLGQSGHGRLGLDGLTVTNDGVGSLEGDTSVVVLEVLWEKVTKKKVEHNACVNRSRRQPSLTFKQISKWSSPAPATIISPVSAM